MRCVFWAASLGFLLLPAILSTRRGVWGRTLPDTPALTLPAAKQSGQARALLREDGVLNVRAYGAVGDGVTDDTAAIRAAKNAIVSSGGGTLFFPCGRYRVSGQLVDNRGMSIAGSDWRNTVIDCSGFNGVVFDLGPYSSIRDLTIDGGQRATGATGIGASRDFYVSRVNNIFFYRIGNAIDVVNAWGASFTNVLGVHVGQGMRVTKFNGGTVTGMYFNNHSGCAVHFDLGAGFTVRSLIIENGGDHRIVLSGVKAATFDGLYVEGTLNAGKHDIVISHKSNMPSKDILFRSAYMNSNTRTGAAPIRLAHGTGIRFEDFHWVTPLAACHPYYIDNVSPGGTKCAALLTSWTRDGGDPSIPLARCNDCILYDGSTGLNGENEAEFLTVADAAGNLPRVRHFDATASQMHYQRLGLAIDNGSASGAYIDLHEDSDYGTSHISLTPGDMNLPADYTHTLAPITGTTVVSALVCHDYSAGTTAWTMTPTEAAASLFTVTNAGGEVDAVFPAAVPGKQFTVCNNSGQTVTFKVSGQTGAATTVGKYSIWTMSATDCVLIYEQP